MPTCTEAEFTQQVIDMARLFGWRCAHFRAGRTTRGWRTPVQADGKGFPDLVLVHPRWGRVIFAELKTDRGKASPEQLAWGSDLVAAGAVAVIWRPRDWARIEATLRGTQAAG